MDLFLLWINKTTVLSILGLKKTAGFCKTILSNSTGFKHRHLGPGYFLLLQFYQ